MLYRRRGSLIEPVFGDIKFNRRCERFLRRGREACRSEWRLIAATHNLRRLWRLGVRLTPIGPDWSGSLTAVG